MKPLLSGSIRAALLAAAMRAAGGRFSGLSFARDGAGFN